MGARRIAGWDMSYLPGGAAHSLGLVWAPRFFSTRRGRKSLALMTQVVIVNCSAGYTGGGVHFHTSFAENRLIDCHIQGCHTMDAWASGDTGGLSLWNGHLTMIGGSITGCRAKGENGGAGVLTPGTLTLADVLVADVSPIRKVVVAAALVFKAILS